MQPHVLNPIILKFEDCKLPIERIVYGSKALLIAEEHRASVIEALYSMNFRRQGPTHYTNPNGMIIFLGQKSFKSEPFIVQIIKNANSIAEK